MMPTPDGYSLIRTWFGARWGLEEKIWVVASVTATGNESRRVMTGSVSHSGRLASSRESLTRSEGHVCNLLCVKFFQRGLGAVAIFASSVSINGNAKSTARL
jgi:hypothetical protein